VVAAVSSIGGGGCCKGRPRQLHQGR
jgi:hypothetical protein